MTIANRSQGFEHVRSDPSGALDETFPLDDLEISHADRAGHRVPGVRETVHEGQTGVTVERLSHAVSFPQIVNLQEQIVDRDDP